MRKYSLILIVVFTAVMTACVPVYSEPGDDVIDTAYTEEELREIINDLLPETQTTTVYDLQSFEEAVIDMVDGVRNGVVGVVNNAGTGISTGSGVIYKNIDNVYYVVTNDHVVSSAISLSIVYERNGLLFEIPDDRIELLGTDPTTDLAVLTFTSDGDYFSVIPMADSYQLQVGQFVFAIGNPLGFDYYGTLTMGVVSGLARYVKEGDFDATLLQHDAAISPGNSGGALVNMNGELIGINNMKLVQEDVSNIGFAIPSNTVKRIVDDLEDDGNITRPYLGISTSAQVNVCGLSYGVCITVQNGGAAEAAGLEDGDVIIGYKTSIMQDFIDIYNFNDLREAILNSSVGETVIIKYVRNGSEYVSEETTLNVHPDDQ